MLALPSTDTSLLTSDLKPSLCLSSAINPANPGTQASMTDSHALLGLDSTSVSLAYFATL